MGEATAKTKKKVLTSSFRILVPLYMTYIVFSLSVFFIFIPQQETQLLNQKKETIHQLTESTLSLLSEFDLRVSRGEITMEEAHTDAKNIVRFLRYGPEGKDYFWINDMHPFMIVHPYRHDLEGKDLTAFKDPAGNFPFVSMVDMVLKNQSGFVNYYWQWKDTPLKVVSKISYVKGFSPWGWIVGTGIYLDDINHEIKLITQQFLYIFTGILIFIVILSLYITQQVFRTERKRTLAEEAKELEELRLKKLLELSQMTQNSMGELTEFALEEAINLTRSKIGYLAFLNDDESELTMHTWSKQAMKQCEVEDKALIYNVSETGLWAEAARARKPIMVNDYENHKSSPKKGYPSGHVAISRILNVPVFDGDKIVALAGVGNKKDNYNNSDIRQLQLMMGGMWKIIQQKKAGDDLRKSEERYRLIADNATDLICVLQLSDYTFAYASPSIKYLLGYSPDQFIRLKMSKFLSKKTMKNIAGIISEDLKSVSENSIDTGRHKVVDVEVIKKDGSTIWAEVTARFLMDDNGTPDRILAIARNITQRRDLEARVHQVQKMEALGTLAGGIAHDFNNILSSILGFTELAKLEVDGDEETKNNLDLVLAAGLRARGLVKHILTFSRRADTRKDKILIIPLINECLKFLQVSIPANIKIHRKFIGKDLVVLSDPTQLHQIIMNLFTNAVYAMKEKGGKLDVELRSIDILPDTIHSFRDINPGKYVELFISDTGCGIPKNLIQKIFEPFFTTKGRGEGTGMGLSTVYGIIKEMKGDIIVSSEEGIGSTFRILIPEQIDKAQNGLVSEALELIKGKGKILLVDDETSIIEWTTQTLHRLGYEVIGHTSGFDAIKELTDNPSDFDLVLTDLSMPGMTGLELSKKIKIRQPGIPIILCTGFSENITPEIMQTHGILRMVMKPLIAGELAQVISTVLNHDEMEQD